MTEIIITPSPSTSETTATNNDIQRLNELYLPSSKYKSSSSSSNVSVSPKDNKLTKSIIYSTESIESSSSSSNLINSSPSPSDKQKIPKYFYNNQDQLMMMHEAKNILNYVGTLTPTTQTTSNLQVNNKNQPDPAQSPIKIAPSSSPKLVNSE